MRRNARVISLFLSVLLVFSVFPGCTKNENQASSAPSKESSVAPVSGSLPIQGKQKTFKIWAVSKLEFQKTNMKTYNDGDYFKELEKRTGIHIDWQIIPYGQAQDQFNLSIASGSYPDAYLTYGVTYPGGLDTAISDGVAIKLNDLVDKYAPNYTKLRKLSPETEKETITDSGNIASFNIIYQHKQGAWAGPVIRKDWLDELGLKMPVTLDDWYTVLKAFKEKKGAAAPLLLNSNGFPIDGSILSAFGLAMNLTGGPFYQQDGKVKCTYTEPAFKDYLTLMNKWYSEGLIDKEFYSHKDPCWTMSSYTDGGKSGIWTDIYTVLSLHNQISADKKINVVALPNPVVKAGDPLHFNMDADMSSSVMSYMITPACQDPETLVKWCDYQYSAEGALLANYGTENKTFSMVNGKPKLTNLITNNPDKLSLNEAMIKYLTLNYPTYYDYTRESVSLPQSSLNAVNTWEKGTDHTGNLPSISFTKDEGAQQNQIMNDVNTYCQEMVTKFIIGTAPMSQYDTFESKLKALHIDDVVKLEQTALNRYNSRK